MKAIIGILLIVAGIGFGLYVGVWLCFIGGIVDIIDQFKAADTSSMAVAIGVAKVFFAAAIGWLSALLGIAPGAAILKSA